MTTKTAADRVICVTQGVLAPVQKSIDCNAHYGQPALVCSGEHNVVRVLATYTEAVTACYRGLGQCDQNGMVRSSEQFVPPSATYLVA